MSSEPEMTELQATLADTGESSLRKYQKVNVGDLRPLSLIKYEVLAVGLARVPGALGILLRSLTYGSLLQQMGNAVAFGRDVTLRHPKKIAIGNGVIIDDNCVLDAKGTESSGIKIDDHVMIGKNSVLSCKNGAIRIGKNTNIAMNCFIQSAKEVKIGKNVLMAPFCYVIGGGDHKTDRIDIPIIAQGQVAKGVVIDDNVWLGADVKVLDGVTIGPDSIIGAGAVVTKDIPEFSIAVGIPARVIRDRRLAG